MPLRVHDTRRREKVDFTTINPGIVNMYVCGVTVYDLCHLGHARCYLAFDLIHRWLEKSGYDVNYVQNFTDIDDKIIEAAQEQNVTTGELTNKYHLIYNHHVQNYLHRSFVFLQILLVHAVQILCSLFCI